MWRLNWGALQHIQKPQNVIYCFNFIQNDKIWKRSICFILDVTCSVLSIGTLSVSSLTCDVFLSAWEHDATVTRGAGLCKGSVENFANDFAHTFRNKVTQIHHSFWVLKSLSINQYTTDNRQRTFLPPKWCRNFANVTAPFSKMWVKGREKHRGRMRVHKALLRQGGAANEKARGIPTGHPAANRRGIERQRQSGEAGRVINLALKALLNIGSGGDS